MNATPTTTAALRTADPAPWHQWGTDLDETCRLQLQRACELPVAVAGALMPDAHVGYGLPIGGVLATDDAVIPYAVGVDIACRMKLTVLDLPLDWLTRHRQELARALEVETRFGIGASFEKHRAHAVMEDEAWSASPITRRAYDKAAAQLGTSGSGNHFVEFGEFTVPESGTSPLSAPAPDPLSTRASTPPLALAPGRYVALLSHSGSRGTGAMVCDHYSKLARKFHPELPSTHVHLAWLSLSQDAGREYWTAMELMGRYAAANHELIHRAIAKHLKAHVVLDVENHHNFAWRETHAGREVIVHRKGATPASASTLGIIPGSMASPGFLVAGRGEPRSLHSCSHGAGRVMSRAQAAATFTWKAVRPLLEERGVTLLSAGIDEAPGVYKNIETVMSAQTDLVDVLARFDPRIVKMAPAGEKAED